LKSLKPNQRTLKIPTPSQNLNLLLGQSILGKMMPPTLRRYKKCLTSSKIRLLCKLTKKVKPIRRQMRFKKRLSNLSFKSLKKKERFLKRKIRHPQQIHYSL